MAIAGTITPEVVAALRCPRCWFAGPFEPYAALTFRCVRCEWPFTLAAASLSAAPAFPASSTGATAVTNPYATPIGMTIALNGATITGFYVGGVSVGTTAGTYLMPVGGVFYATYSVASPTWTWQLPVTTGSLSAGGTAVTVAAQGTVFTAGQVLVIDAAGTSDVVTVTGTPTGTSIPCTALNSAHTTGKTISVAQLTPALSGAGIENVPLTAY